VTFDARDSDAIEGVITAFKWDFGDGQSSETVSGFTSHTYASFGVFNAQLTITNDQGGTDDITTIVFVNGAPQLNLTFPESIRSGDSAFSMPVKVTIQKARTSCLNGTLTGAKTAITMVTHATMLMRQPILC
jgi:PKD repeat protein